MNWEGEKCLGTKLDKAGRYVRGGGIALTG